MKAMFVVTAALFVAQPAFAQAWPAQMGHFKSFKFSDHKVDVRFEGPVALTTETYKYRIETKGGMIAEQQGVSTSVLKKVDDRWKILMSHNSGRKPKGS